MKTSFRKSMILQAVSILLCKSIMLVILLLDQIDVEQSEYITQISRNPCFLNAETISSSLLKKVQQAQFTHLLISPELAISDKFCTTAANLRFKKQLSLVVVDEAHLVSQWGRQF